MATMDTTQQKINDYRIEVFEALGFDQEAAALLAEAKQDNGWLLDLQKVRTLMRSGCTPELALRILL